MVLTIVVLMVALLGVHRSMPTPRPAAFRSFESLPSAAQTPIAEATASGDPAYAVRGLKVVNSAQRLRASFGAAGITVHSAAGRLRLSLSGYGRGRSLSRVPSAAPVASANRVTYDRGSLIEWYANDPLGLEQGFDVLRSRAGRGPLTIAVRVSGNLEMRASADQVALEGHGVRLRYGGLSAVDADGRRLATSIAVAGHLLLLRVVDAGARYPLRIDPFLQQAELTYSGTGTNDSFGYSVAISGNTIVVGAPYHKVGANSQQGAVYVFVLPKTGWATTTAPKAVLTASDGAAEDWLGYSVAVSGSTVLAGAPLHSADTGVAYVFEEPATGWASTSTPTAELSADDGKAGDKFGWSVALSTDAAVVGAPFRTILGSDAQGAAYVFQEPATGWTTTKVSAELTANNGATGDGLGSSVAISSDDTVVVGAPVHAFNVPAVHQGAAYLWVKPPGGYVASDNATAELSYYNGTVDDDLGASVAISGDTVAVGSPTSGAGNALEAGLIYVFVKPATGWDTTSVPNAELSAYDGGSDQLGRSLSISGNTLIAGAPYDSVAGKARQGAAYLFTMPPGGWSGPITPSGTLTASDGSANDNLGFGVAIDGATAVAGAPLRTLGTHSYAGAAYVFGGPPPPPPAVTIVSPANGARFYQGEVVNASYSCSDAGGPGLASCVGTTVNGDPINTATLGKHTFAVTAVDTLGTQSAKSVTYTVVSPPPPVIGSFHQSAAVWREIGAHKKKLPPVGTTFSFTLNEPARVTLTFVLQTGRRAKHKCVAPTAKNANKPSCRLRLTEGKLAFNGHMGSNTRSFNGKLAAHRLPLGTYAVTIAASDTAGHQAKTRSLTFRIVS